MSHWWQSKSDMGSGPDTPGPGQRYYPSPGQGVLAYVLAGAEHQHLNAVQLDLVIELLARRYQLRERYARSAGPDGVHLALEALRSMLARENRSALAARYVTDAALLIDFGRALRLRSAQGFRVRGGGHPSALEQEVAREPAKEPKIGVNETHNGEDSGSEERVPSAPVKREGAAATRGADWRESRDLWEWESVCHAIVDFVVKAASPDDAARAILWLIEFGINDRSVQEIAADSDTLPERVTEAIIDAAQFLRRHIDQQTKDSDRSEGG